MENQEVKPKEHKCPSCGKTFKHQPSLSRHLNGNVRYNIKPCTQKAAATTTEDSPIDYKYVKRLEDTIKVLEDKIKHLQGSLACKKESVSEPDEKPETVPYKYNPDTPNYTQYPLAFTNTDDLLRIINATSPVSLPAKLFTLFHLNPNHKEHWSVVVKNKSHLREIHYWDGDDWRAERLDDFFENFVSQIRVMLDELVFDYEELCDKYDAFTQELDFEEFEDSLIYSQLKKVITNEDILRSLRVHHGFKAG